MSVSLVKVPHDVVVSVQLVPSVVIPCSTLANAQHVAEQVQPRFTPPRQPNPSHTRRVYVRPSAR